MTTKTIITTKRATITKIRGILTTTTIMVTTIEIGRTSITTTITTIVQKGKATSNDITISMITIAQHE